jgi:ribosomal 50S subunit-recycling heat shock protein
LRIDQFLSVARLIKRRTQAKLACDRGLIYVDGIKAKPSREIKAGQKIVLNLTRKRVELEILKLPLKGLRKDEAKELYHILSEEEKKEDSFFEK